MDHYYKDSDICLHPATAISLKVAKSIELDKHPSNNQNELKKALSQELHQLNDCSTVNSNEQTQLPYEDEDVLSFLKPHAQIIASLDTNQLNEELLYKKTFLIHQPTKPVLILDIDGTLLITLNNNIILRPYTSYFLQSLKTKFSLWVWTAGDRKYLCHVMSIVDPGHSIFEVALDNNYCTVVNGIHVKDARMFGNLDLNSMTIMDDQLASFAGTIDNGILVSRFQGNAHDDELLKWLELLLSIDDLKSIPLFLHNTMHLKECIASLN